MTIGNETTFRASTLALGLVLAMSAGASAVHAQRGYRPPTPAASSAQNAAQDAAYVSTHRTAKCDCPMMNGDAATRRQCMNMMSGPQGAGRDAGPPR